MIKRWCSWRVENILTLGKFLRLWFCFLLHSILFFISQNSYRTYKIISAMSSLAVSVRVPGSTERLVYISNLLLASERSERDTLRSVQFVYYIYIIVRAIFVLITRKEGGA